MSSKKHIQALQYFSYGIYVLTSKFEDEFCASTINWVTQTSKNPSMIAVCLKKDSNRLNIVREKKRFILHILSKEQKEYATYFMTPTIEDNGKLNSAEYSLNDSNLPILIDPKVYMECEVESIVDSGDHPIVHAKVVDTVVKENIIPLELRETGWTYGDE
ncbi:MAG: flavin reductase [Candidatus Marinimicrobia bacterium]|nr:flavin reductase [Candidatus Neomarinimicrobiota bacterium]MBL7023771.1 flavin reductase [Candidatus Neomarinimicrobiota bacterium]MBL7110096.1 flavin reductase [Candidatus Neomarinimicrobiota bacterium]